MKNGIITFLFILFIPLSLFSQNGYADFLQVERLASIGKLWGQVKYFHPYLAYRDIDWDSALVKALLLVYESDNKNDYTEAVQVMLDELQDPLTKVKIDERTFSDTSKVEPLSFQWLADSILFISLADYRALEDFTLMLKKMRGVGLEILKADGVVFDLRNLMPSQNDTEEYINWYFMEIEDYLSATPLRLPNIRARFHSGFKAEVFDDGMYYSAFEVLNSASTNPLREAKNIPFIFIINSKSELPLVAWTLQKSGIAIILSVDKDYFSAPGYSVDFELSDSISVKMRTAEMISTDGDLIFKPDKFILPEEDLLSSALDEIKNFPFEKKPSDNNKLNLGNYSTDKYPKDIEYPSKEYRLLSAFKIWTIINYFFPYKELMDKNWNEVLIDYIPRFVNASNAEEYRDTVLEMIAFTNDSHVRAEWPSISRAHPMFNARYIENKLVVEKLLSGFLKNKIKPGDEIISIDGEEISNLEKKYRPKIAASTEQGMKYKLAHSLFYGKDSSKLNLVIKTNNNEEKEIHVIRSNDYWQKRNEGYRDGDIIKFISPEIGYLDLDRLQVGQVDSMFEVFKNTDAIIFDMRGYPNGTAWHIVPRLNKKKEEIYGALIQKPFILSDILNPGKTEIEYKYYQPVGKTTKPPYAGQCVVLIDERAVSQAEHTCLFFEAVTDVTFIGSPTMGANGNITDFYVPGNILIRFTGMDVQHADGRQLQRIGILPDIEIIPTVEGIRAGKDEVLDRAIEFINNRSSMSVR